MSEPPSSAGGGSSGLKPPSKIGRPCIGSIPKPAIPQTPKSNGTSSSSVRKLTEDLLKTRINEEVEEEEDDPYLGSYRRRSSDRKSSIGGISSNDSLWGDARRLSEAGVRRYSDNSVVLTEDTDSFIVGDRVWVGGSKPGRIAFIGETKFAPGDWAGIVLDHPIGKNDGSVNGHRYFQCEAKKGVFSRLERLSRFPLEGASSPPPPPAAASPSPPASLYRRITPPPPRTPPPLLSSPSPTSSTKGEVALGDRVIVMSGQGSKIGVLRYRGETEFAPGIWCGVELDDPIGKNDGSVEGIRYFECLPKYGLFAPLAKVSKSPAPDRRASCQIHHTAGPATAAAGGSASHTRLPRRTNSKESLTSVTSRASTVTSTASRKPAPRPSTTGLGTPRATPQELLKSKQEQIEKLLKERDLDRSRMVRAASQTEEAEKKLHHLQAEFDLFKAQSERKSQELENAIQRLQQEKGDLQTQLEDWKFRADEESITKSTLEEEQEEQLQCMDAWKKAFAEKERELKDLQLQLTELGEAKEEIQLLKAALETSQTQSSQTIADLKQELIETIDRANRMEQNYNEVQNEIDSQSSVRDELTPLRARIRELEAALTESERKIKNFETALKKSEETTQSDKAKYEEMKQTIVTLENKLKEANESNKLLSEGDGKELKIKCEELSSLTSEFTNLQGELVKIQKERQESMNENVVLKQNISEIETSKKQLLDDFEKLQKSVDDWRTTQSGKELELQNLHVQISELNEAKKLMTSLKDETDAFRNKASEIENELKKELIETVEKANQMEVKYNEIQKKIEMVESEKLSQESELNKNIAQLEKLLSESQAKNNELETHLKQLETKLKEHEILIDNLKKEKSEFEFKLNEAETYNKLLGEGEQKLKAQCAEMSNLLTQVNHLKNELNDSQNKYRIALEQNEALTKELNEIQASSNNQLVDINQKYTNDIENLRQKLEEFSSELKNKEKALNEEKIKADEHDKEFSSLQKELVDLKNHLDLNQNSLNNKDTEIVSLKNELEAVKSQLQNFTESSELTKKDLSSKIQDLEKEVEDRKSVLFQLEAEKIDLLTSNENEKKLLSEKIASYEKIIQDLECDLEANKNEAIVKVNQMSGQEQRLKELEELTGRQAVELETRSGQVQELEATIGDSEKKLKNLLITVEELKTELTSKELSHAQLKEHLNSTEKDFEERSNQYITTIDNLKTEISTLLSDQNELLSHVSEKESENVRLSKTIEELNERLLVVPKLEQDLDALRGTLNENVDKLKSELSESLIRENVLKENFELLKSQYESLEKEKNQQISSLEQSIQDFKMSLLKLEEINTNLECAVNSAQIKIDEKEREINELKKDLREVEFKLQETETCNKLLGEEEQELKKKCADLSNLMTQVCNLQEQLDTSERNYENICNLNESLKNEINELEKAKKYFLADKEKFENTLVLKEKIIFDKDSEIEALKIEVKSLNELKTSMENDLSCVNLKLEENKNQISELVEKIKILESEKLELNAELDKAVSKLQESICNASIMTNEIDKFKLTVEEKEKCISELEHDSETKDSELATLKNKLSTLEEEISNLNKEKELLKNNLLECENVIMSLKDKCEKQETSLEENDLLIKMTNTKIDTLIGENKNLLDSEQKLKNNLSLEIDNSKNLKESLEVTQNNYDKFKSEKENEILSLKETIIGLEKSLSDLEKNKTELKTSLVSETRDLELELIKVKELNVDLENKLTNISKVKEEKIEEINNLINQLDELKSNLSLAENSRKTLEDKYNSIITEFNDFKNVSKSQITDLNEKYINETQQVVSLTRSLTETQSTILELENNIKNFKNTIEKQEEAIMEHVKYYDDSNMKYEKAVSEIKALEIEINALKDTNEGLLTELNSKKNSCALQEELLDNKDKDLKNSLNIIKKLENELLFGETKLKTLLEEKNSLKDELNAALDLKEKLRIEIEKKDKEFSVQLGKLNSFVEERDILIENFNLLWKTIFEIKCLFDDKKENIFDQEENPAERCKILEKALLETKYFIKTLLTEKDNINSSNNTVKDESNKKIQNLEDIVKVLLEDVENYKTNIAAKDAELLALRTQLTDLDNNYKKQTFDLNERFLKIRELEKQMEENAKLKQDNQSKIKVLEAQLKVFASEKDLLQDKCQQLSKEVSGLQKSSQIKSSPDEVSAGSEAAATWQEEKELAASEINFLNSIIVDMKKKNDFLNERIQAFELAGASSEEVSSNGTEKKKKKAVTPRMFCDICDVFDAHETEDCPRQATDSPPPVQAHRPQPRGSAVPRPYCDLCEVFGHDTEDCDDTQTF